MTPGVATLTIVIVGDPTELVTKCDSDAKDTLNTSLGYGGSTDWSDLSTFNVPAVRVSSGRPTGRCRCRRRRCFVGVSCFGTRLILIRRSVRTLLLFLVVCCLAWRNRVGRRLRGMLILRSSVLILGLWIAGARCFRR